MSLENTQIAIKFIDDSLTHEQKQIIELIYLNAKKSVETVIVDKNIDSVIKITQTLASIIKLLEKITLNGEKISGQSKKKATLELFRLIIDDLVKDEIIKNNILTLYNLFGENILETMVDVSKTLNIAMNTVIDQANGQVPIIQNASCCVNLLTLFINKKVSA